jgi:hypothetical protein
MKEYRIKDSSHGGDILNESGKALGIMLLPAEQRRNAMTDRVTASLLSILFPALNRVTDLARAAESHDDLASIVAALESFKGKEGRYPAELGELVESGLLKKLPCDPFSKDAAVSYVYKPTGDGYLLYSRDEDRDDDGGTEGRTNRDGDIVFSRPAPKSETPDD